MDRAAERPGPRRRVVRPRRCRPLTAPTRRTAPRTFPRPRDVGRGGGTRTGVKCLHAHYAYHLAGGDDPVGAWVASRVEPVHREQPRRPRGRHRPGHELDVGSWCWSRVPHGRIHPRSWRATWPSPGSAKAWTGPGGWTQTRWPAPLEVIGRYCRRARALGAGRIRVAATSAVRDASNRADFVAAVRAVMGADPGDHHGGARGGLSFLGGTYGLDPDDDPGPYLVQDIGGGSTEFVIGRARGAPSTRRPRRWAASGLRNGSCTPTRRRPRTSRRSGSEVGLVLDEVEDAVPMRDVRHAGGRGGDCHHACRRSHWAWIGTTPTGSIGRGSRATDVDRALAELAAHDRCRARRHPRDGAGTR